MKKFFLAVAAVATLFATSCNKENTNAPEEPAVAADNEFVCVIDQNASQQNAPAVSDDMGQMAHIDNSNNVWWQEGDQIAYYGKKTTNGVAEATSGRYELTCSRQTDNRAYFSAEDMHFYSGAHEAYYPASIMALNNQGQKVLTLPDQITIDPNKKAVHLPMYGEGTGTHYLTFHNICAVMKITIPSSLNGASRFKLSSNKALNGAFTITNNTAVMSATPTSAEKKITVRKSSGNFATNEVVYVAVPAQHYDSLTIEFFNGSGISVVTKVVTNKTLAVSKVYPITVDTYMDHEYVDLGLSVKWATCNVGAPNNDPRYYGGYFAWGETSESTVNTSYWYNYKYVTYDMPGYTNITITKYTENYGKTVLEPSDDAAHVNWGGNWRMPTKEEWQELLDANNCDWEYCQNYMGSDGYFVTSKINSNFIFLPASGYCLDGVHYGPLVECRYWSSTLHIADEPRQYVVSGGRCWWAYFAYINTSGEHRVFIQDRCIISPIRPVCP